jgi:hypothetical protein
MTDVLKLSGNMKVIPIGDQMKQALDQVQRIRRFIEHEFFPIVKGVLGEDNPAELNVEFVELMEATKGIRFELSIKVPDVLTLDKLGDYTDCLEEFTRWEQDGLPCEGYLFTIGDGDDMGAVQLNRGKFCIWVRGWKE